MKIPVPRKLIERLYGEVDVPLVRFYFDPTVETGYVRKNGLGYEVVLGRKADKNTIAHELAHIKLNHLESKDRLSNIGLNALFINLIQDVEVELYIRLEGYNSAPQFSDEDLVGVYNKVSYLLSLT